MIRTKTMRVGVEAGSRHNDPEFRDTEQERRRAARRLTIHE
jgi:hypothetical protein